MNKIASAVVEWVDRPSLNKIGSTVHSLWHGSHFGAVDRQVLLCRVANELLWRLGDPRELSIFETAIDTQLHGDIFVRWHEPKNMTESLLLNALYAALTILDSRRDLSIEHELGGQVYYPLMVLEGLLLKQTDVAMRSRKAVTHLALGRFRVEFMEKHEENDRGWQVAAAKEFKVSTKTVSRIWRGT